MSDEVERLRTFDEWSAMGYRVLKGEKSEARNANGVPLFSSSQVWQPGGRNDYENRDVDEDTFTRLTNGHTDGDK